MPHDSNNESIAQQEKQLQQLTVYSNGLVCVLCGLK